MSDINTVYFAREIAELAENLGLGIFSSDAPSQRTIFVGELPEKVRDPDGSIAEVLEALWLVESPSPAPHEYIDTEYPIIDFWARAPHTDQARAKLQAVFNNFHRRYGYETANWHIYFSKALGNIVDVDRDREGGKLFRLSVQFICRNLNNIS